MPFLPSNSSGYARVFILIFIVAMALMLISVFKIDKTFAVSSPYVTASGTKLLLSGDQYQFTGVNAFNLATYPGYNAGCGGFVNDLDIFFSKLRPNSAVRLWAFQGTAATNTTTQKLDWAGLDRVVNAASKNGKKLILVLGNQDGHCDDGHYKDKAWYLGGYKQAFNDIGNGLTPLPYLEYIKAVVSRYKDVPAIAMWEPINEPAAGECISGKGYECYAHLECRDEPAAAAALKSFFDTVGGTIKSIDNNHLISSGALGNGQCGTVFEDYQFVHGSQGIDVGSYHDYDDVNKPIPGDAWNGLQKRINQMAILNKPLYVGEVGMIANGAGCMSLTERQVKMKAKMDGQFSAGMAGFIPWSYTGGASSNCNYDILTNDPLLTLLHDYPVSMSTAIPTPLNTPFPVPIPIPADTQPPTTATNLQITSLSPNQLTFSWTPATDNKTVDRYEIYRDYSYITATWVNNFTDLNLTPGKSYKYYLRTRDGAGNSSETSAILSVTTPYISPTPTPTPTPVPTPTLPPDVQAPTAPSNLAAIYISANQISISWKASIDNVGVSRYDIFRDGSYLTSTTGTSFVNTNLQPGTTYTYHVKGKDATGNNSAESNKLIVTTTSPSPNPSSNLDTQPPAAATNLTATIISPTQVKLNWTAATDNVGVSRYEVYRDYSYINISYGTSFINSNLTPGKTYLFYLKTRDLAGNSSTSSMKVTVAIPL